MGWHGRGSLGLDTEIGAGWDGIRGGRMGHNKTEGMGWHDMVRAKTKTMEYVAWHERRQDKGKDRMEWDKMGSQIRWDGTE